LKKLFTVFFVVALLVIALVGCSTNTVERVIVVVTATPDIVLPEVAPQVSCDLDSVISYTEFILNTMPLASADLDLAVADMDSGNMAGAEQHLKDAKVHQKALYDYTREQAGMPECLSDYNYYVQMAQQYGMSACDKVISGDYSGAGDDFAVAADWMQKAMDSIQMLLDTEPTLNG